MSSSRPRWLAALGGAVLAHLTLIAAAIAWVAIYSYLVAPGQAVSAYEAHAQVSAPWVSLVLGIPLLFWLCFRLGRSAPVRARATTLALLAIYLGSDLAMILSMAPLDQVPWGMVAGNYTAKALAGWFGGAAAARGWRMSPA